MPARNPKKESKSATFLVGLGGLLVAPLIKIFSPNMSGEMGHRNHMSAIPQIKHFWGDARPVTREWSKVFILVHSLPRGQPLSGTYIQLGYLRPITLNYGLFSSLYSLAIT